MGIIRTKNLIIEDSFATTRGIFSHQIWKYILKFRVFFLIYGKARWEKKPTEFNGIKINRGQWLRSFRNMQKDLEFIENKCVKMPSLGAIKDVIDELVNEESIKTRLTRYGLLFTVVNYDKYQFFTGGKGGSEGLRMGRDLFGYELIRGKGGKVRKVKPYGKKKLVKLGDDEVGELKEKYGEYLFNKFIMRLENYIPNKPGPAYVDHFAVIETWVIETVLKKEGLPLNYDRRTEKKSEHQKIAEKKNKKLAEEQERLTPSEMKAIRLMKDSERKAFMVLDDMESKRIYLRDMIKKLKKRGVKFNA